MAGLSKSEIEKLDSIQWHDGILDDICFSMGKDKGNIELKVRVYDNEQSPSRRRLKINFTGVLSFQISCDINELLDRLSPGNISGGYFKASRDGGRSSFPNFHLYLFDGYIHILSKDVKITRTRSS